MLGKHPQCRREALGAAFDDDGVNYEKASTAYFEAVYSVLTGKVKAEDTGAKLEEELVWIPGLRR
jgi:hypothetical protein